MEALTQINIPGVKKAYSGKVRDLYQVDEEHMLIVSTDRISAFDHVFPNGIPGKGKILNTISNLWFRNIKFIKNHIVETEVGNFPKPYRDFPELLQDRSVLVRKTARVDFECVARGYIIGTGWKDYQKTGMVCGIRLPEGLRMAERLQSPLFTPSTKADEGHDANVSMDVMRKALGENAADRLGEMTLRVYGYARDLMEGAGIILADTKLEFGFLGDEIILIDEVLTPDSSRFWEKSAYRPGESPLSLDKQYIRDYLDTTPWDKNSPPPPLPEEVVSKTLEKYREIQDRIGSLFKAG